MHLVNIECFIFVTFLCMACALCFECNSDNHKDYECCPNYYKVNGTCTECPAGTFGLNCSAECPGNYYGQFCKKECFCRQQYCNPADGCNLENVTANGDEFPCIQNYYISNSQCRECPNGTFGVNCSQTCQKKFFGRLCTIPCNCFDYQYCDPVKGCIPNSKGTDNGERIDTLLPTVAKEVTTVVTGITKVATEVTKATRQWTSKWKKISFALIGAVFVVLVVAGVFYLRSRLKTFKKHWSFLHTEEDHGEASLAGENIEVVNLGIPTHSIQGHASEERREALSNVYDDLRLSQMMEINTVSGTDAYHFAACSEETLNEETFGTYYESVSKRHYINSYPETSGEEETANNYEHFQIPTEYSILSLKRNIDPSVIELYGQHKSGNDGAYDIIIGQLYNASERSENSQSESESETCLPLTDIQD